MEVPGISSVYCHFRQYTIDTKGQNLHNIKTYISFKECHRALWKEKKAPEDGDT